MTDSATERCDRYRARLDEKQFVEGAVGGAAFMAHRSPDAQVQPGRAGSSIPPETVP